MIINRLWKRYMGLGLVEPADDWEHAKPSHPELLDYLARELVQHNYDLKHVARLILNSQAYQRLPQGRETIQAGTPYLYAGPVVRRLSAEQLVDSMFLACGKPLDAGPMSVDIDGARSFNSSLDLGEPTRAWMFASLSNERDRPSLALPLAKPFVTLLETFGWSGTRQSPISEHEQEPTVLQPAIVANGLVTARVSRLSDDNQFTQLALVDQPLESLIEQIYLRLLTRPPRTAERAMFVDLLASGYAERRVTEPVETPRRNLSLRGLVTWSNHLDPEATTVKTELEAQVRAGDPPSPRLAVESRERMEDMVWTLVNSPEFVFVP